MPEQRASSVILPVTSLGSPFLCFSHQAKRAKKQRSSSASSAVSAPSRSKGSVVEKTGRTSMFLSPSHPSTTRADKSLAHRMLLETSPIENGQKRRLLARRKTRRLQIANLRHSAIQ